MKNIILLTALLLTTNVAMANSALTTLSDDTVINLEGTGEIGQKCRFSISKIKNWDDTYRNIYYDMYGGRFGASTYSLFTRVLTEEVESLFKIDAEGNPFIEISENSTVTFVGGGDNLKDTSVIIAWRKSNSTETKSFCSL